MAEPTNRFGPTSSKYSPTRKNTAYPLNILCDTHSWAYAQYLDDNPNILNGVLAGLPDTDQDAIHRYFESRLPVSAIVLNKDASSVTVYHYINQLTKLISDKIGLILEQEFPDFRFYDRWVALGLEPRAANCLRRSNLHTFEDVVQFCKGKEEALFEIANAGESTVRNILTVLRDNGYFITPEQGGLPPYRLDHRTQLLQNEQLQRYRNACSNSSELLGSNRILKDGGILHRDIVMPMTLEGEAVLAYPVTNKDGLCLGRFHIAWR